MQIGERRIKSGQLVILALGAASSPRLNDRPDRFDIQRRGIRHLGLGLGAHHCLGAFVAQHEAAAAIAAVLQRWPHLRLAEPPTWRASLTVRGPVQLRVHTEPPV